jgi:ribosomal protein L36
MVNVKKGADVLYMSRKGQMYLICQERGRCTLYVKKGADVLYMSRKGQMYFICQERGRCTLSFKIYQIVIV